MSPVSPIAATAYSGFARDGTIRGGAVATIVESLAWALMVVGIVIGLVAMLQVRDVFDEFGVSQGRPYLGEGLLLMVGSVFNCLLVVMVAAYIQFRTEPAAGDR